MPIGPHARALLQRLVVGLSAATPFNGPRETSASAGPERAPRVMAMRQWDTQWGAQLDSEGVRACTRAARQLTNLAAGRPILFASSGRTLAKATVECVAENLPRGRRSSRHVVQTSIPRLAPGIARVVGLRAAITSARQRFQLPSDTLVVLVAHKTRVSDLTGVADPSPCTPLAVTLQLAGAAHPSMGEL